MKIASIENIPAGWQARKTYGVYSASMLQRVK